MGKEIFKYVDGTLLALAARDLTYEVLEIEKSFVMLCLGCMQPDISRAYLPTAYDISTAVTKTYLKEGITSKSFRFRDKS